tara:strand:- start:74 stop:1285 length:1212 start_codon:yes stop_codon:yes gene_type:complete
MKNNVLKLKDFGNDTKKFTEADYMVSPTVPYTIEQTEINQTHFWNEKLKPEWFDVSHFGLDFDKTNLREKDELESKSNKGDLQKVRLKENPKKKDIKINVVSKGKDIRERPIIIVKDKNSDEILYIQDGNTFHRIGVELDFPNFMTLEFYKNSRWSETKAIALGVYYNLLYKSNGEAKEEDIELALGTISQSPEFKKLLKDTSKNGAIISEKLHNYWDMINKFKNSKTVNVTKIINNIIFKGTSKAQKLNPTKDEIFKDAKKQGLISNHLLSFSVAAAFSKNIFTQHWLFELSKLPEESTLLSTICYISGSETHNPNWWIKAAYKFIKETEKYFKHFRGASEIERCSIAGVYQNHIPTSSKFALGSIVSVEQIKRYYKEIYPDGNEENNEENDEIQNLEDFIS